MSAAQQQIVGAGGASLLILNAMTGSNRKALTDGIFTSGASAQQQQRAHAVLVRLGTAGLFVVGATLLAGTSDTWGASMVAIIVAILILFAINKYNPGK